MANNYEQATVEPTDLRKGLFTEEDMSILESSGIEWEDNGDSYYFFAPEFLCEEDGNGRTCRDVFQRAIRRSCGTIEEVVISGACTCSKMRAGEFGGFVVRITENAIEAATTYDVLQRMRSGRWE